MNKQNENTLPLEERALLNDVDLARYLSTGRATTLVEQKEMIVEKLMNT